MTWIFLMLSWFLPLQEQARVQNQTVNAIIGDASFYATFRSAPNSSTDETLRLQTHLRFVHAYLSAANTGHLSQVQQANREEVLDILSQYMEAGTFPVNTAYPGQRRPWFIDDQNRYCAVGYLMKETVGKSLPKKINERHQYGYVMDMTDMPEILEWAEEYGLTLEECAMIQPTYGYYPPPTVDNTTDPAVAITTGVFCGVNTGLAVGNAIQMGQGQGDKLLPFLGLTAGAGQFVFGLYRTAENDGAQTVDVINMSVGMASASMALIQLLRPEMAQQYGSLYLQPQTNAYGQTNGAGIGWVKNF